ncbi:MAG: thioredoxin domain-containing protein [Bacteroidales bacterium]|nr:thioredoxin domain-containing protein [Bacteroidales bacterium]
MKKTFLALIGAALVLTACSKNQDNNTDADKETTEASASSASDDSKAEDKVGSVRSVEEDDVLSPSMKVDKLTVIDFNASWCVPCRRLEPIFKEMAMKYGSNADFVSVDIDNCPMTANAFGVENIPTVIFLAPDGTVRKFVGLEDIYPADKFEALITSTL